MPDDFADSLSWWASSGELRAFYQQRDFAPAWTNEKGMKPETVAILRILHNQRHKAIGVVFQLVE